MQGNDDEPLAIAEESANIPLKRRDSFQRVIKEVDDFLNGYDKKEEQPGSLDDMVHNVKNLSDYELPLDDEEY